MPNPETLTSGRLPTDNVPINVRLPKSLLAGIDKLCQQQDWKRSYCIEMLVRHSLGKYQIGGYNVADLELILGGIPVE